MREPYTQLYVHVVWATWDRLPLLSAEREAMVYASIQAECRKLNAEMVGIGGTDDHVHVLVRMPTTLSVATLVKQLKGSSSHLVNHTGTSPEAFGWQGAYGAFTVSKGAIKKVIDYLARQKEHHRQGTVYEEYEPSE